MEFDDKKDLEVIPENEAPKRDLHNESSSISDNH
jgi:hypothetical protein